MDTLKDNVTNLYSYHKKKHTYLVAVVIDITKGKWIIFEAAEKVLDIAIGY